MIVYVRQRRKNYQQQSKNFHCVHRASRSLQHSIDHLLPEWWLHLSADNLLLSSDAVSYGPSQLLGVLTFHSVKRYFHLHSWLCSFLLVSFFDLNFGKPTEASRKKFLYAVCRCGCALHKARLSTSFSYGNSDLYLAGVTLKFFPVFS